LSCNLYVLSACRRPRFPREEQSGGLHSPANPADTPPVAQVDDFTDVLEAAQQGDGWAVATLWRAYQPQLLRYLRGMCGDAHEDVASDVWIESAARLPRFRGDEPAFRAWLFTRARRRAIDHHRRSARTAIAVAEVPDVADPTAGGEWEQEQALRSALDRLLTLSQDQREVVLLRVVAGLEVDQVAGVMGKQPGTVRVLHHRALKALAAGFPAADVTPDASQPFSEHADDLAA
jgi:RNA polymerase sigma-70 factor, ECF subfamily